MKVKIFALIFLTIMILGQFSAVESQSQEQGFDRFRCPCWRCPRRFGCPWRMRQRCPGGICGK